MDVDSLMTTEPVSRQEMTQHSSFGEAQATAEALQALGEEGTQVLVYSGSGRMLFHGSKALEGNSAIPHPADTSCYESAPIGEYDGTDIFTDVDPDYHVLIVQQGQSTIRFWRPTEDKVRIIKAVIAWCPRTNGIFAQAFSRPGKVNQKRKQQLLEKEGGSCEKPDVKLPSTINKSSLIVIKKASGNIKSRPSNHRPNPTPSIEELMKPVREKDEDYALVVVFHEWKLSAPVLSALPLVPFLSSQLPCFYMANPGTSQGNHIFGNMMTQERFLVDNSDLQSSSRLLYSKDGWLLLRRRERDLSFGRLLPRYPIFLLNPSTGARMDFPSLSFRGCYNAFFTTTQGTPDVIVYVQFAGHTFLKVCLVRPGGSCWEEHSYDFRHGQIGPIEKTVLCGSSVYCLSKLHTIIFKLADLSWYLVTGGSVPHGLPIYQPLEVEGKVVVVGRPERFTSTPLLWGGSIPFFRMEISGDKFDWVEITDVELDGKIWFINIVQSFCVKVAGSGQKICWFSCRGSGVRSLCGTPYALHCLNLTTRAHCRLTADSGICSQIAWVDLGCPSDPSLLDRGITGDDLLPGF
ncbi:uncharacterized protein LOC144546314 [Carex rostrata]